MKSAKRISWHWKPCGFTLGATPHGSKNQDLEEPVYSVASRAKNAIYPRHKNR